MNFSTGFEQKCPSIPAVASSYTKKYNLYLGRQKLYLLWCGQQDLNLHVEDTRS